MGAVRRRQLIQLLAFVVALDMAVGVVALSARGGGRNEVRTALVAGSVGIPLNDESGTGILAGAHLNKRRTSTKSSDTTASTEAPPMTSAAGAAAPPATMPPPATSTTVAPGTPTSARAAPDNTTATSRQPGAAVTTRPAPVSSTTATPRSVSPRPPATAAPAAGTTATSQPAAAGQPGPGVALTDPAGDTFVDGTQKSIKEPRADIVRARAVYRPEGIGFLMQVQEPVDPRTDGRWAGDATFALWSVDTTGDGTADYELQYYALGGEVGGVVTLPGTTEVLCDVIGGYDRRGYAAAVEPGCLGNPASFSYRVTMYYDTNPQDDDADVAADVSPNGGWSFAVKPAS